MFKRLKDRLTDEPKQPIQKDLINLADNSSEYFAISEDGEASDTSSPVKQSRSILGHSDTESDRDDFHLDTIGKDQLFMVLESVKARYRKYKTRALEYSKSNAELQEEIDKLKHTLAEGQDHTLRRVAELREQCVLEQQAKAHLEENLRLVIDEKEQVIRVLQTQIKLLKDNAEKEDDSSSEVSCTADLPTLQERVKRQEALLAKCKETIQKNKERQAQLQGEKEALSSKLEHLTSENNGLQVRESMAQEELKLAQGQLADLARQREEGLMAMAETKHNMHLELEHREKQLGHLRKQVQDRDSEISSLRSTLEDVVSRNAAAELTWEKEMTAIKKEGERQLDLCRKQLEKMERERAALDKQLHEETSSLKEALASQTQSLSKVKQVFQQQLEEKSSLVAQLEATLAEVSRQLKEKEKATQVVLGEKQQQLEAELARKTKETNQLSAILRDKEGEVESLSASVKTQAKDLKDLHRRYSSETESLQTALKELLEQLSALRQEQSKGGLSELKQDLSSGMDTLERLISEGEETKSEVAGLAQRIDFCASMLRNTGVSDTDSLRQQIEDLQKTCLAMERQKNQLSQVQEELQKQASEQQATIDQLESQLAEKRNEIEELERRNAKDLAGLRKELETSKKEIGSLSQTMEERSQQCATLENDLQATHRQVDVLQDEISDKQMRMEELTSSHNEKDVEIASLKDQLGTKEDQLAAFQKKMNTTCNKMAEKSKEKIAALEENLHMKESQVEAAKCQLGEKEGHIKTLEEELEATRGQASRLESQLDKLSNCLQEARELLQAKVSEGEAIRLQLEETEAGMRICKEKLELAEQNLSKKSQLIELLEQQLEQVCQPLTEASEAQELRCKLLEDTLDHEKKENELLVDEIDKVRKDLKSQEELVEKQAKKLHELNSRLKVNEEEMEVLRDNVCNKEKAIENLNEELKKKVCDFNHEIMKLQKSQDQVLELERSLTSQEEVLVQKTHDYCYQLEKLEVLLSDKNQTIEALQASLHLAEEKFVALQEQHNNIIEAKKKEIGEIVTLLEKQLDVQAEEIASLEDSSSAEISRLKEELGSLKSTNGEVSQELAARCQENEMLSLRLQERETKLSTLETKLQDQLMETREVLEEHQQEDPMSDQSCQVALAQKQLEEHSRELATYYQRIEECHRELGQLARRLQEETDQLESLGCSQLGQQIGEFMARLELQAHNTQTLEGVLQGQLEQLRTLQELHQQSLEELDRHQDTKIYSPLLALEERVTAELVRKQAEIQTLHEKLDSHPRDVKVEAPQENHVQETFRLKLKQMVREFSKQLDLKEQECDSEITKMTEQLEQHQAQLSRTHRLEMADIQRELEEKCSALVSLESHCQQLLQDNITLKKSHMEVSDWENGWEDAAIDPALLQDKQDMACQVEDWAVPAEDPHLPRPVEYEYLKNILFEYMMGKEPVTLAKVIAAVMRFPEEQTRLILERENARLNVK